MSTNPLLQSAEHAAVSLTLKITHCLYFCFHLFFDDFFPFVLFLLFHFFPYCLVFLPFSFSFIKPFIFNANHIPFFSCIFILVPLSSTILVTLLFTISLLFILFSFILQLPVLFILFVTLYLFSFYFHLSTLWLFFHFFFLSFSSFFPITFFLHPIPPILLFVTGLFPSSSIRPACLRVSPDRSQFFWYDSVSLSCENQSNSTGWKVKRKTPNGGIRPCSSGWGSASSGSACIIRKTYPSDSGVYWCQSGHGEMSNGINITITGTSLSTGNE